MSEVTCVKWLSYLNLKPLDRNFIDSGLEQLKTRSYTDNLTFINILEMIENKRFKGDTNL